MEAFSVWSKTTRLQTRVKDFFDEWYVVQNDHYKKYMKRDKQK